VRGAVVSTVPVASARSRRKQQAHVGRTATGGNTLVATRGELQTERSRPSAATVAGIIGGVVVLGLAAAAFLLVHAGVL
jgi:hypothetical protein